jgi:putative nucleotidyltransferase with HDIG domain
MVNSVRFAPAIRVTNVFDAVQLIGFDIIRALVLSIQVFEFCQNIAKSGLFQSVWDHSIGAGFCAKRLAHFEKLSPNLCEEAFLLGLLHDIGKVVLAASSREYHLLWDMHSADTEELTIRENETFGATHAQVGAYLLRLWGLPDTLADAVEAHHRLDAVEFSGFNPLLALHIAQELSSSRAVPKLNTGVLNALGLESKLPEWKAIIAKEESRTHAPVVS